MNKLMLSFAMATALFTFGCKKKGGGDEAVKKMGEFKDAMCKCGDGDTACAQKVVDDQKKYADEMAKSADKDAKPDPELAKKMEPIMAEYTKCATKAMTPKMGGGGGGGSDSAGSGGGDAKGSAEEKKDGSAEPKKDEGSAK